MRVLILREPVRVSLAMPRRCATPVYVVPHLMRQQTLDTVQQTVLQDQGVIERDLPCPQMNLRNRQCLGIELRVAQ